MIPDCISVIYHATLDTAIAGASENPALLLTYRQAMIAVTVMATVMNRLAHLKTF